MNDEEWPSLLDNLQNKRPDALAEILYELNTQSAPPPILETLLQLQPIYDCAKVGEDNANLAIDIVRGCLLDLEPSVHDVKFPELVSKAVKHPNAAMRGIVLVYVLNQLSLEGSPKRPSNKLILLVLDELQQKETTSSAEVTEILSIRRHHWSKESEVLDGLVNLLKQNEVVRCRVYELGVQLARKSPHDLSVVEFILDAALAEVSSDDVLLVSSVMEILVQLAEQNHGLSYMERRGVLEIISKQVENYRDSPLSNLMLPGIMKFFGKVAAVQPQKVIQGYPDMLSCLFQLLLSEENPMLPIAMDTLANLLCTLQGKTLMQSQLQPVLAKVFGAYGEYLQRLPPPLKIRLLESLESIFFPHSNPSNELISLLGGWYEIIAGGQQIDHLMKLLNTPFADLQVTALAFLNKICEYDWGVKAVQQTAGAIEFLLSRQQQLDREVKLIKWLVVEKLSLSAELSPSDIVRFTAYVKEGPDYMPTEVNIATEGSN
ncbi:26S proteasome non-ATPase regulatory subunit 5 [Drosophila albomicans]|uniref:26S proteasome non-ATPase regulatory subunit 5 n=1 Tax=Drosophila albomicans TaxID=7291 RepID=A0A6P8WUV1_DROAB|nr:26S proteasome non-ATPase regulatory subunit 5 [Drosophila albomicans]